MLPVLDQTAVLQKFCPDCAAEMPETAAFCPACGRPMTTQMIAMGKVGFLHENFAAALSYVTFLPAVVFLLAEPYRKNAFVRFHSIQCLLFSLACIVMGVLVRLFSLLLFFVPALGPLLSILLIVLATLAAIFLWIVLFVKAFQGEKFSLPLLGAYAEQYSGVA